MIALAILAVTVLAPAAAGAQEDPKPTADVRIQASVEEGPPGGGISTGDGIRYDFRFVNGGPETIPAGALLVVIFVGTSGGADPATMEVARFGGGGLVPAGAGSGCGIGRREIIRCTNLSELQPDREIRLQFENRHPQAVAGDLALSVDVLARTGNNGDLFTDPATGNNTYRGPTYRFADQPTTTTSSTTTTTMPTTTSTTESTSSSSSTSESSSTTDPSSTTTSSSTTTTEPTTTSSSTTTSSTTTTQPTTTSTTTTTVPTTVSSTTSLQPTVVTENSVLGQSSVETSVADQALVPAGPESDGDGGFPLLLLAGLLALSALLVGIAIAVYYFYFWEKPPPLVDIRDYNQQRF